MRTAAYLEDAGELRVAVWDVCPGNAVAELANAYINSLTEFAATALPRLRLLPLSAGIYARQFDQQIPTLALEALSKGYGALDETDKFHNLLAPHLHERLLSLGRR